jgi:hypothetical protein
MSETATILGRYQVDYVLVSPAWRAEAVRKLGQAPDVFERLFDNGRYALYQVHLPAAAPG